MKLSRRLKELAASLRYGRLLRDIETCCLFLGYPRSGGTLLGELLNAHRNVVFAHELHVMALLREGCGENELYARILERDRWFQKQGRKWSGYDYNVPGQWQGRVEKLRVVGDKRGAGTAKFLEKQPGLLSRLRETVRHPIRFIHGVRNPYDTISTLFMRHNERVEQGTARPGARPRTLEEAVGKYFRLCRLNALAIEQLEPEEVRVVRHEDLVASPAETLSGLCSFLGIDSPEDYLSACAGVIFAKPRRSRRRVEWPEGLVRETAGKAAGYSFLAGYEYDG